MAAARDATADYFRSLDIAFDGLDRIFETEGLWAKRHNLIAHVVADHLRRLRTTLHCWQQLVWFADRFKIDTEESGFPVFKHVLDLGRDAVRAREKLADLPSTDQIRAEMVELLLKFKQFPDGLQRTMAERLYFEQLQRGGLFSAVSQVETIRHSFNPRSLRPFYVVHWSAYDGTGNLPLVYQAVIEDSSADARKPTKRRKGPWGDRASPEIIPGLPNGKLAGAFQDFVAAHSGYSLNLTSIATALDRDFPTLHPKQLRRIVLGPIYIGNLTTHNQKVQRLLGGYRENHQNWVLTWSIQELHSKEEVAAKRGIWGGSPAQEIYYINTDDIDCAQQGVSALERHALLPHAVYQAAYAQGLAQEIFGDYHCYIASGDHILRHI